MKYLNYLLFLIATLVICFVSLAVAKNANSPYQSHSIDLDQDVLPKSKNYPKKWNRITGFEHSGLHWEQFIVVYTNQGERVYKHNFLQYSAWFDDPEDEDNEPEYQIYPTGTVFIKENYKMLQGKPSDIASLTVMRKREPGFYSAGGDWEYLQFDTKGKIIMQGAGDNKLVDSTCANCHNSVAERDYIFSNFYSGTGQ